MGFLAPTCGECEEELEFFGPIGVRCANQDCTEYTTKEDAR
jgi:hypothetical protein